MNEHKFFIFVLTNIFCVAYNESCKGNVAKVSCTKLQLHLAVYALSSRFESIKFLLDLTETALVQIFQKAM